MTTSPDPLTPEALRTRAEALAARVHRTWDVPWSSTILEEFTALVAEARQEQEEQNKSFRAFWWAFWKALNDQEFCYVEMDCEALVTETAVTLGLLVQEPYDPERHEGKIDGEPEPGDLIYVLAPALRAQEPTP